MNTNLFDSLPNIALEEINEPLFRAKNIKVFMLRLDQCNDKISGNKWFKLKYNLMVAKKQQYQTLLSFGGAYSNHLHALAAAAVSYHFSTIGVIRGEAIHPLNHTLNDVVNMGMYLHYINRSDYRKKKQTVFLDKLISQFNRKHGKIYVIPEGGSNNLALKGTAEIPQLIPIEYQYLCLGCGTGGTLAGISTALDAKPDVHIVGFSALKGGNFLKQDIAKLQQKYSHKQYHNWSINLDYHFGGFAKKSPQLLSFMESFKKQHQIELDFIYTGKMMYGIYDLCKKNYFTPNSTIVAIHTGGIQGNRSIYN